MMTTATERALQVAMDISIGLNQMLYHGVNVMMFVSYCDFHNICILLDVFFEFQITADLLCVATY